MGRQRPTSVTNALRVQWALVGVSAIGTGVTVLMRDALLEDWADARGGLDAVEQSGIATPAFVPVALVTFIVYASLAWVIAVLFRAGHRWARWSLLSLAAGFLFAIYVIYRADPPPAFLVVGVVAALFDLALIWFLAQRDSGEWVRGAELAEEHQHAG
ncbi:MAG: hypothetical protein WKF50_00160 [Nocardioides sp.]